MNTRIFVVWSSWDGQQVEEFTHKDEALEFITKFTATSKEDGNGQHINLIVNGHKLEVEPVEYVSKMRFKED